MIFRVYVPTRFLNHKNILIHTNANVRPERLVAITTLGVLSDAKVNS